VTAPGASLAGAAEAVWQAVAPALPGFTVEVLPEIDSTNTELMRRARAGRSEPLLLVAQRQTAGRGRLGRGWQSRPGDSLTFSLGLALAPADWSGLSLAVGVSVAETLHPDIRIKWPNDLWLGERKLAGILIETATAAAGGAARFAVIGVGINIARPEDAALATAPAWLRELLPQADASAVLLRIAPPLVRTLQLFEQAGYAPFRARFAARDLLQGREVLLSDGLAGVAAGTDERGALLVHTADAVKTILSSEVSVRPVAGTR
jgi:BirA family transcriptional regulator, biotin operon repressor / biotin---[acetyl-CoA-carboxylase] ligase